MAQQIEIDIPIFERNLKLHNRKGLRRSYTSVEKHPQEYLQVPPLSSTSKMVIQVTLDKDYADKFQEILKGKGFTILGSSNTFHIENLLADFEKNKQYFPNYAERIQKITAEYEDLKAKNQPYELIENDDVTFYFLPYNEGVATLYEFIKTQKDDILAFAKENDITIMLKVVAFTNQLEGFFGFNFFDADQKEEEVVVDFAARMLVAVNFTMPAAVYAAAVVLAGIGESKEELADPDLNVHLVAEELKYKKA